MAGIQTDQNVCGVVLRSDECPPEVPLGRNAAVVVVLVAHEKIFRVPHLSPMFVSV